MKINVEKIGVEKIQEIIDLTKKYNFGNQFIEFIKNKSENVLNQVMQERLIGGTTNDEEISLYKSSNHFIDTKNGFILYNDAQIDANKYNIRETNKETYSNGTFSIAVAFEYGTGVHGTSNVKIINPHAKHVNDSWYLPKNVTGESGVLYDGYSGFEIYRFTAEKINNELGNWINEYMRKVG